MLPLLSLPLKGSVGLGLQLLGGGGFLQRPVELPMAAVRADFVEPLPADDIETGIPEGLGVTSLSARPTMISRPSREMSVHSWKVSTMMRITSVPSVRSMCA